MRPEELVALLTPGARVRFQWPTGGDPIGPNLGLWKHMTGTVVAASSVDVRVLADGLKPYSRHTNYTHVPRIEWILDVLPRDDSAEELEAWLARPTARVAWTLTDPNAKDLTVYLTQNVMSAEDMLKQLFMKAPPDNASSSS